MLSVTSTFENILICDNWSTDNTIVNILICDNLSTNNTNDNLSTNNRIDDRRWDKNNINVGELCAFNPGTEFDFASIINHLS